MLVNAKCPNCGANIEVDKDKEAGICKYCGSAFITEKAINNYNISADKVAISNSNVTINQSVEHVAQMVKIYIGRETAGVALSELSFDIIVDGISYATISNNNIVEIDIDKNKDHRIQCVANAAFGDCVKSNVIYFEKGKVHNIVIRVIPGKKSGERHRIEIHKYGGTVEALRSQLKYKQEKIDQEHMNKIIVGIVLGSLIVIAFILFIVLI